MRQFKTTALYLSQNVFMKQLNKTTTTRNTKRAPRWKGNSWNQLLQTPLRGAHQVDPNTAAGAIFSIQLHFVQTSIEQHVASMRAMLKLLRQSPIEAEQIISIHTLARTMHWMATHLTRIAADVAPFGVTKDSASTGFAKPRKTIMNLVRNWSLVAVTAAVFSSSGLAHADQYGPATNRNNPARSDSEDKTAFFGLCWPFCGYNRGCGYGNGYGACPPYGYGGGYYGGGCYPRPNCAPCAPCAPCVPTGGGYGGYGYGAVYPYGGYGGAYGGGYGGGCSPAMYPAPIYAPPPCGLPAYGAPCYQGLGYNAEDNDRPASAPSFTARRRNNRPALAEDDSPFFQ